MSTADSTPDNTARPGLPWARLHRALMPDYNRQATVYWWTVVAMGTAALLYSAASVVSLPLSVAAQVLAGMAVAMLAGCFPVRIGSSRSSFAAGEVFIILLLLMHGPAAATLAAGCETLVGAMRTSKRWTSRIASPSISAISMFSAGSLLDWGLQRLEGVGVVNGGIVIASAMVFSLVYFSANTLMVAAVPRLKRSERLQMADWLGVFGWVGIAFAGSGALAGLLFLTYQNSGLGVILAMVPIMAMLLATLHYHHRQQEAHGAMRQVAAEAAAREAESAASAAEREGAVAARHLQQLEESERRFHSAFTHASIGMALLSFEGRILQTNDALRTLLGHDDAHLCRHNFQEFVGGDDRAALQAQLARISDTDFEDFSIELRCRHSQGREAWAALHCSFFSEPGSSTPSLILQVQDISARRDAEAGLHKLAFNDSLTGLPNRRRFGELLAQAVAVAQADAGTPFAVMFLDFDRFKIINDSLGHAAGDEFLVQVAQRLRDTVRPSDVVARLGGDEFAVLACGIEQVREVVALAERLLEVVRQPYRVADAVLSSSASIGITTSRIGYTAPENALRDADIAMYKAKASGKDRYALFDTELLADLTRRMRLEGDLRAAVESGALRVAFQPLYELADGRLIGFEALARWTHPEFGTIGPDVFIPIAEEAGLIVPLTDFVLHRACRELREWQQVDGAFAGLTMNVNISAKDLGHTGLVSRITHALVSARLEPQCLTIELTETILMDKLKTALPILEDLHQLGVRLSVDDFGTGYSSLAHLSSLPVDSLKVDRSFIMGMSRGSNEAAVVRAVVQLGQSLGKRVVAEGIETPGQLDQLREMGCHMGQGYHLSRPLTPHAVEALLERTLANISHAAHATLLENVAVVH